MFQKRPTRTSNNCCLVALGVPDAVNDPETIPRIKVKLDHFCRYGTQPGLGELHATVTKCGIFTESSSIPDGRNPQQMWPFAPEYLRSLLLGDYDNEWVLYSFELRAYALTLMYYNVKNPARRGMIELGQDFTGLQVTLRVPVAEIVREIGPSANFPTADALAEGEIYSQYSMYLYRHPVIKRLLFGLRERPYVECAANVAYSAQPKEKLATYICRFSLEGEDTVYLY